MRVAIPLFALLSAVAACSSGNDPEASQTKLQYPKGTQLWTANANQVPMCWHEFINFPDQAGKDAVKFFVMKTIQEGWMGPTTLNVTWVDCPTSGSAQNVRVKLRIGDGGSNGNTSSLGMATLTTAAQRVAPADPPGLRIGFPSNWNTNDATRAEFRGIILHEFGHILGFGHEQDRSDGPSSAPCYGTGAHGYEEVTLGAADPTSIMGYSYCTGTQLGELSGADIRAVRSVYGIGHSGSNDFDGDGRPDLLWYNSSTGESQIWHMSAGYRIGRNTVTNANGAPALIGPPYHLVGSRDMNRDGKSDLVWHNDATGETQLWLMNGAALASRATVISPDGTAALVGPPFSIVGVNDFNQDGYADILWHNSATGETQIWYMNVARVVGRQTVTFHNAATLIGLPWSIVSTNDFNQDGKADILWHNESTGETQIWYMNGSAVISTETVRPSGGGSALVGLPWQIVGSNDFDLDGRTDILWHNQSTGETQIWYLRGALITNRETVNAVRDGGGALVSAPWSIVNH